MPIFISYSHKDKEFVDKLAAHLIKNKARVWIDKWELNLGDSIISKVQDAIQEASALLVILSKNSTQSEWCKKELNTGLIRELDEKRVVVLPVLLEDCDLPVFLRDKLYADFRENFDSGLNTILEGIAKHITADVRGRVENSDFVTDWAVDWGEIGNNFFLRLTFIDQTKKYPYSVLTIVNAIANDTATKRFNQYRKAGLDWFGRLMIIEALGDAGEEHDINIILENQLPKQKSLTIHDPKTNIGYEVNISCRWLGEDTGRDVLMTIGEHLKRARNEIRNATPKASKDESRKLMKIVNTPIEP